MARGPAVAVGRIAAGGAWVGFAPTEDGYQLVFCEADGHDPYPVADTQRGDLLNAALAYFGDGAEAAPDEVQATHGDVAQLVGWLADTADAATAAVLRAAVDAIDDGLAADAVMLRLEEAAVAMTPGTRSEQADPIDLLAARYRALSG